MDNQKIQEIIASCDHTLLKVDATWEQVRAICDDAVSYGTASVCIPPSYAKQAVEYMKGYAGFSPSTYQSGQLDGAYAHMEKRGSRYLRYALYNATKYVCHWDPTFTAYLAKKRAEGKHYNVAISHAVKKLVRVIYHLEKTKQQYIKAA